MHCLKKHDDVILQSRRLDDACNRSGSDQKDSNADNLGKAELRDGDQAPGVSGYQDSGHATERKGDQRIDRNPADWAKSKQDDDQERAGDRSTEGRKRSFRFLFNIRRCSFLKMSYRPIIKRRMTCSEVSIMFWRAISPDIA